MKKNVIVSLADSNYYPLLNELIDSIKRFKESDNIAICILDAGLETKQKSRFSSEPAPSWLTEPEDANWELARLETLICFVF